MLKEFQYIYNGARIIRVTGATESIGRIEAIAGAVKSVAVQAPNVGAVGNFVFNVRKNGTAILSGGNRLTVNSGAKRAEKTDANFGAVSVVKGDLLSFAIDEVGSGGILGELIFTVTINDGVSSGGATSLDELSDVVISTPANDDFIQRKSGSFVNRTKAQVKSDLDLTGTNSGDETTATIKTKLGISTLSGSNTGDETASSIGNLISGATAKTTPVDADVLSISDSAASNVLKKLSFTNLKSFLKTYFDTLYQVALVSGTNIKTINSTSLLGSGDISISGGGTNAQVDVFTANGTWTKSASAKLVDVFLVGGGGGGGSGRKGAAASARGAGSGASGGSVSYHTFAASQCGSTEAVAIGAGGAGGAAQTTNSTNGNNGSLGGNTTFGTLLRAIGGGRGGAGSTGTATGGVSIAGFPSSLYDSVAGSNGGANQAPQPTAAILSPGAGAGGGGTPSSNVPNPGGNGGAIGTTGGATSGIYTALISGGNGGAINTSGSNGTDAPTNSLICGTGGGGGGASHTTNAGNGGNGGFPGGGGGGGGASTDSVGNSGAGGNGGNGIAIIITYF